MQIRGSYTGPSHRRLGSYLLEAGLLTPAQVDVALNDQNLTGLRFGEVLDARGWVKQQTVEYFMQKIVLPDRELVQPPARSQPQTRDMPPRGPGRDASRAIAQATVRGRPVPEDHPSYTAAQDPSSPPANRPIEDTGPISTGFTRRELPISKPLPPLGDPDGDNWVG